MGLLARGASRSEKATMLTSLPPVAAGSAEEEGQCLRTGLALDRQRLFEGLVAQHRRRIYGTAWRLTRNRDDAEDLVQDSILDALRSFDRFQAGSRFDRWMTRIITHNHLNQHHASRKRTVESLDRGVAAEGEQILEVPDSSYDPPRVLDACQLDEPIERVLRELGQEYRAAVVLRDLEDYSYEDIAAALRVPLGTVRSRINRGRTILKQKLLDYRYSGRCAGDTATLGTW
jgi:RNA polymerase sigma-70 factor, ECF subfamily